MENKQGFKEGGHGLHESYIFKLAKIIIVKITLGNPLNLPVQDTWFCSYSAAQ